MEYKDYYATLGVPKTASQADIKKAYRRLARELHPDRNKSADAERRFKELNEANAVLSDPEKRKQYDELGANWQAYQQAGFGGGATDWSAFGGAPGGARWTYRRVTPEEMDDLGGFSDFFRTFFGEGAFGGSRGTRGARSGGGFVDLGEFGDLQGFSDPGARGRGGAARRRTAELATAETEVSLADVMQGATRTISIDGRRLEARIPPGVRDGARIRLRGAVPSENGGPAGDLLITVRVRNDPRFTIEGSDLVTSVDVPLATAVLGGEVSVPTPTGSLKLRIRPNTQNGQEIRVAGRGVPRGSGDARGDLVVRTRVTLPRLDEAARRDFERFARDHIR